MLYPNLQPKVLTGIVTGIQIDQGNYPLSAAYGGLTVNHDGTFAQWDEVTPLREIVKSFEARDGLATPTDPQSVRPRAASTVTSFKKRYIAPENMDAMRVAVGAGDERADSAWRNLDFMLGDMDRRYRREPMEYLWAGALQDNLTITVVGQSLAVDYGLPTSHDLVVGAGGSWADQNTDIDADVETAKRLVREDAGMRLSDVWCGRNIFSYIRKNDTIKSWLVNYAGADARFKMLQGETITLFNLTWHKLDGGYLSSSVWTPYIGDDKCIFVPPPSQEWIGWHNGSVRYPTKAIGAGSIEQGDFAKTYGVAVWSEYRSEPPLGVVFHRWNGLPVVRFPSAVVNLDTTP